MNINLKLSLYDKWNVPCLYKCFEAYIGVRKYNIMTAKLTKKLVAA